MSSADRESVSVRYEPNEHPLMVWHWVSRSSS